MPSLCVTKKGTLLAFAELRKNGSGDIDIVVRRSTDGLVRSKPENISRQVKRPDWGRMATGPGAGIVEKFPSHA